MKKILLINLLLINLSIYAQTYEIGFKSAIVGVSIDSIKVENITNGSKLTLNSDDILILQTQTGLSDITDDNKCIMVSPNPSNGDVQIRFFSKTKGIINICVSNDLGQKYFSSNEDVEKSSQTFQLIGLHSGLNIISINSPDFSYSSKVICLTKGNSSFETTIQSVENNDKKLNNISTLKSLKANISMNFTTGDIISYTGFSGLFTSVISETPTTNKTISFNFPIPIATITSNNSSVTVGSIVSYTAQSTNNPISWSWDFGDGTSSTLQNPTHTYNSTGKFTITLIVSNSYGSHSTTFIVTVNGLSPIASFYGNYSNTTVNTVVNFTDNSTNNPTTWSWDFGDGSSSTLQNPSHSYNSTGTFIITLTVSNSYGSHSSTFVITIHGPAPIANFSKNLSSLPVNTVVSFTDNSTNNPTTWSWDFGDGTSSALQNPSHTYSLAGTYTISLTVTNANGNNTTTSNIVVFNAVKDIDGNIYKTITIGTQTWQAENLRTTKYNDGTNITNITDGTIWGKTSLNSTSAYCNYNNEITNASVYGQLYNWYAVNTGKLCPTGWHVPSWNDWTTLQNYLTPKGYIAKSMASTTGWNTDPTVGNVGNNLNSNNSSGFTALPSGECINSGTFDGIGTLSDWWSSTKVNTTLAFSYYLKYNSSIMNTANTNLTSGLSVRCIKD